jgi:hypothetical protein
MNLDRVRARLQNGFRPFVLELSSGRRLNVRRPEFVALGKGVLVVVGEDDSVTTVDALHITAIQEAPRARPRK